MLKPQALRYVKTKASTCPLDLSQRSESLALDAQCPAPKRDAQSPILTPKGPCAQHLGFWGFGISNCSAGFGEVHDYWVLGPIGYQTSKYVPAFSMFVSDAKIPLNKGLGYSRVQIPAI